MDSTSTCRHRTLGPDAWWSTSADRPHGDRTAGGIRPAELARSLRRPAIHLDRDHLIHLELIDRFHRIDAENRPVQEHGRRTLAIAEAAGADGPREANLSRDDANAGEAAQHIGHTERIPRLERRAV